jgi:uncharacterized alpha-E superfamily protein
MINEPKSLTFQIKHLADEIRRLEQRLKSEPAPDQPVLNDFRHAVDNVRLTAWSVSELLNAHQVNKDPNTVLAFLSAERVRRFDQLVKNLCADIERGLITVDTNGMQSLGDSVNSLQQHLAHAAKRRIHAYNVKEAAS